MDIFELFFWGICGGVFAEIAGLFEFRRLSQKESPEWIRDPLYWIITISMVLVGGLLVVGYVRSGENLSPLLAINVGASAPLIIRHLIPDNDN